MRGGMQRWLTLGFAVTLVLPACGASNEVKAVTGAAVMIAATGVNRKLTGECWAACTPGYVCDHESGMCVVGECRPSCPETQACVRMDAGLMCVDKGTAWNSNLQSGQTSALLPSGGAPAKSLSTPANSSAAPSAGAAARACAVPGSSAWYQEQTGAPVADPGGPLARDFVGLWSVVGATAADGGDAPRPLVVTEAWFGRRKDAATHYRSLSESASRLEVEVWSDAAPARAPLSIEFLSHDQLRLHGVAYQREDCARTAAHDACCALPRENWVRLGPVPAPAPQL